MSWEVVAQKFWLLGGNTQFGTAALFGSVAYLRHFHGSSLDLPGQCTSAKVMLCNGYCFRSCSGYAHHAFEPQTARWHRSTYRHEVSVPGTYSLRYRFGAEPPFMMLQLSSKLPLTEAAATPGAERKTARVSSSSSSSAHWL